MRPKLTLSQSPDWGNWSLMTVPSYWPTRLELSWKEEDKLPNDEAGTLNLAGFSLPISRDIFYIGGRYSSGTGLIFYRNHLTPQTLTIHITQSGSLTVTIINTFQQSERCSCRDILNQPIFVLSPKPWHWPSSPSSLQQFNQLPVLLSPSYSYSWPWTAVQSSNIAMETSEPDTRWPESDDSQDYWESDLSCIHCPLAVGGKSLYLSTDYLLSSPAQIFPGIKNNQAKIYDNDPGPRPPRHVVLPWFKTIKQTAQILMILSPSNPFPISFVVGERIRGPERGFVCLDTILKQSRYFVELTRSVWQWCSSKPILIRNTLTTSRLGL